jgi:hypothetical protein
VLVLGRGQPEKELSGCEADADEPREEQNSLDQGPYDDDKDAVQYALEPDEWKENNKCKISRALTSLA